MEVYYLHELNTSQELIVKESSATIDSFERSSLPTDHMGLNKFSGPKDGAYGMVSGEISTIVQQAPGILKSRENGKTMCSVFYPFC